MIARGLQLVTAALWLGMVIAISFIEAPLKFLAPEITVARGLGIGRLVFTALNIAEILLAVILLVVSFFAARYSLRFGVRSRAIWWFLTGLVVTLGIKVLAIRPPLNARSDQIIAGVDPGPSSLHTLYVVAEVITVILLVLVIISALRQLTLHSQTEPLSER